jgi:hypothetical protein
MKSISSSSSASYSSSATSGRSGGGGSRVVDMSWLSTNAIPEKVAMSLDISSEGQFKGKYTIYSFIYICLCEANVEANRLTRSLAH